MYVHTYGCVCCGGASHQLKNRKKKKAASFEKEAISIEMDRFGRRLFLCTHLCVEI